MKKMLSEAFERYGMSAEVRRGENAVQTKAFVQPLRRESGEEPSGDGRRHRALDLLHRRHALASSGCRIAQ